MTLSATLRSIKNYLKVKDRFLGSMSVWDIKSITKEYKINDFITVKLENKQTIIYINEKKFRQCKYLLFSITDDKAWKEQKEIKSIDDLKKYLDKRHEFHKSSISPETEFWGHCSNLEAWVENNYDLRIIHTNLGFPLLEEIAKHDQNALIHLKEEIAYRIQEGGMNAYHTLKSKYKKYFKPEELEIVLEDLKKTLIEKLKESYNVKELYHCSLGKKCILCQYAYHETPDFCTKCRDFSNFYRRGDLTPNKDLLMNFKLENLNLEQLKTLESQLKVYKERKLNNNNVIGIIAGGRDEDDHVGNEGDYVYTIINAIKEFIMNHLDFPPYIILSHSTLYYDSQIHTHFHSLTGVSEYDRIMQMEEIASWRIEHSLEEFILYICNNNGHMIRTGELTIA